MKKILMIIAVLLTAGSLAVPTFAAAAQPDIAVVDTGRIFAESTPGKAGDAHLAKVRNILQKGMDDLSAMYKGKEDSAEAQSALREGFLALERQMAMERQAVLKVLNDLLIKSVKDWRNVNKRYVAVFGIEMMLDADKSIDVTDAMMKEMNKQQAKFADLPTVTVNPPKGAAKPKEEPKKKQ